MKSLLLLHGALGSKEQFTALHDHLSSMYNIVDINFSGHGGNIFTNQFSIRSFAEETLSLLDQNSIQSIDVFGYSMGGYVALRLAHDHPGRLDRIMTLGTKFEWTPESAQKELKLLNPEVIENKVPKFADTLSRRHQPNDWKVLMHKTAVMMHSLGKGEAMEKQDFRKIQNPVMISVGSEDNMVTNEESKKVVEWLPNGAFLEIPNFKHPIEAVDVAVLAEEIKKFID